MTKIEDIGISPFPWRVRECQQPDDIISEIVDNEGNAIANTFLGYECEKIRANNRMFAAAPKVYAKAYALVERLRMLEGEMQKMGIVPQIIELSDALNEAVNGVRNCKECRKFATKECDFGCDVTMAEFCNEYESKEEAK